MIDLVEFNWQELGIALRARLLRDKAPGLCAAFEAVLPFESIQWHTVIAGENMSIPTRVYWMKREYAADRKTGRVFFFANGQRIVIPYGETNEPGKINAFAEFLPEDLPQLRVVGRETAIRMQTGRVEPLRVKLSALTNAQGAQ